MDEELQALYRAMEADPSDFAAWLALLKLLLRLGRTAEAEELLKRMIMRFGEGILGEIEAATGGRIVLIEYGALLEVIIVFGAGLALPASRWGKLTLDDDADRDAFFALIVQLYLRHLRERTAYRKGDRRRSITQLWADADYLWRLVQAFLRRYPGHDSGSLLRVIERDAGGWVEEYWQGDDAWYSPPTPPAAQPLPPPPITAPSLPPQGQHPHTVERPRRYEDWLRDEAKADARRIRERIVEIRARLRELMRKRRDPGYDYPGVGKTIDGFIEELTKELQKLRDRLKAEHESTGEEFDEPLDPPPPPPTPPWPLGHPPGGYRLYINPKTGQSDWFTDPAGSDSDWKPASDYHWGWIPDVDPATGKIIWKPGWVPGPTFEEARAGRLMGGTRLESKEVAANRG